MDALAARIVEGHEEQREHQLARVVDRGLEHLRRQQRQHCSDQGGAPIHGHDADDAPAQEIARREPPITGDRHHDEAGDDEEQDDAEPAQPAIAHVMLDQRIKQRMGGQHHDGRQTAQILDR